MKLNIKITAALVLCGLALIALFAFRKQTIRTSDVPSKTEVAQTSVSHTAAASSSEPTHINENLSSQANTATSSAAAASAQSSSEQRPEPEANSPLSKEDTSIDPKAAEALKNIFAAADVGDTTIMGLFTSPEKLGSCPWCKDMFEKLADVLTDPKSPDGRRFFASQILSFSGNLDAAKQLVSTIKLNEDPEKSGAALDALARMRGTDEIIDFVASELDEAPDDQTRQALVAMLGYQHTLSAAKGLYEDLVNHNDPEGYADKGIGFVIFKADESAIPFVREKVALGNKYSAIALTSLLESGEQGGEEALVGLNQLHNQALAEKLATRAGTLVKWRNPESYLYLKERLATETDPGTSRLIALLTPGPSPR